MIKIERLSEPASLKANWRKWNVEYAAAATDEARRRLESRYRKKDVQKKLEQMFHGKCAYCESPIGVVDYGHIEHFRPKHMFPKRMYLWRNMLLSCTRCNGAEFKGAKFPSKLEGGPILNPCVDDASLHLDFEYNLKTKEARVKPLTPRGAITEKTLGLNRDKLLVSRSNFLRKAIFIRTQADHELEAKELMLEMFKQSGPYLAFLRKYIDPINP